MATTAFHGGADSGATSSSRDSSLAPSEPEMDSRKRSLDRRRETSRYAARDRRGKEADIFIDLKDVVPIVEESTVTHVDRIALLRVASTMCRMRRNAGKFLVTDLAPEEFGVEVINEQSLTESLDGFVLLADSDGTILYVSESVSVFLGLTQTDLVGRFLKEFVHTSDYDELIRWSTTDCDAEEASTLDDFGRYLVVRMKTVISPRGRTLNLKSALYKAILCRFRAVTTEYGRLSLIYGSSTPAGQGNSIMLANAAVKGSEATNGVYMTRHTCDMHFSYVSDSLNFLLRHEARSLMGTSFYELIHPADVQSVAATFRELFKKGHCRTAFYRLMGVNGAVAWAQTEATTVNHTARGQKGQYVLCVHSIAGMQSELESWADPPVSEESASAAHPAYCVSRIKQEIPDMADYMGRQPEFIECVDFTPLIDPVAEVGYSDFNPQRQPANRMSTQQQQQQRRADYETGAGPQPPKHIRKNSYDEVLDWLVRDEADSPPPPFRSAEHPQQQQPQYVTNSYQQCEDECGADYCCDDDDLFRDARFVERDPATGRRTVFRTLPAGARRAAGANDRLLIGQLRQPVQQQPPQQQQRWVGGEYLVAEQRAAPNADYSPTAAAMAGRNDGHGGAAAAAGDGFGAAAPSGGPPGAHGRRYVAAAVAAPPPPPQQQQPDIVCLDDEDIKPATAADDGTANLTFYDSVRRNSLTAADGPSRREQQQQQQRVSRLDAHQQRQGAVPRRTVDAAAPRPRPTGAVAARAGSAGTRTVSAIPSSEGYTVSGADERGNGVARNPPNAAMYAAMRAARCASGGRSSSRCSSVSSAGNRSTSRCSTDSYGQSAARRYAQPSPSPSAGGAGGRRFGSYGRSAAELGEQRPLNVNQLSAAPRFNPNASVAPQPQQQQSPPANFYYAARNPQYFQQQQQPPQQPQQPPQQPQQPQTYPQQQMNNYPPNQYSAPPPQRYPPVAQKRPLGYAGAPSKRMAYGDEQPYDTQDDANPYTQELAHLAPFVPGEDVMQLENLDLQNMFPEVDFSEFFAQETSPPAILTTSPGAKGPVAQKQQFMSGDLDNPEVFFSSRNPAMNLDAPVDQWLLDSDPMA